MGKAIARLAKNQGMEVTAKIDPIVPEADSREISKDALARADVCIDFSQPDTVLENIKKVAGLKKNIVVGTTGWYDNSEQVKKTVEKEGIGLIYASNFSLGVNIFFRIVRDAARKIGRFPEYDAFVLEKHHNKKKDSPSGTAKIISEILLDGLPAKKKIIDSKLDRQISADELHVTSVRAGSIPGTHVVGFDSSVDTIELRHTARSRDGFALGALQAAKWIAGKRGFYSVDDMMREIIE